MSELEPGSPGMDRKQKQLMDLGYPENVVVKELRKQETKIISAAVLPDLPHEDAKIMDTLNLGTDAAIQSLLQNEGEGKETVLLTEKVTKVNRKGKKQERYLMITQTAVYNLMPKKYGKSKRRVAISNIGMITLSSQSDEFAIHVPTEYDYHFISAKKEQIAQVLQDLCSSMNMQQGDALEVVYSEDAHLKDIIFTKDLTKYEVPQQNESNDTKSNDIIENDNGNMDTLNLAADEDIRSLIENEGLGEDEESVVLSEKVIKINRKGKNQERYLMVTDVAVYNLIPHKYKQSKRRVAICDIGMITLSAKSREFAIHVPTEYDYHLASKRKEIIAQCLTQLYKKQTFEELIVVESDLKHLKDVILTKTLAKYEDDGTKEAFQQTISSMQHQDDD